MAGKTAVVTRDGMILGGGRLIWDGRDWPALRDARLDALVADLVARGWTVSDHRPAQAVAAARADLERSIERDRWQAAARGFQLLLVGDVDGAETTVATLSGHLPQAA